MRPESHSDSALISVDKEWSEDFEMEEDEEVELEEELKETHKRANVLGLTIRVSHNSVYPSKNQQSLDHEPDISSLSVNDVLYTETPPVSTESPEATQRIPEDSPNRKNHANSTKTITEKDSVDLHKIPLLRTEPEIIYSAPENVSLYKGITYRQSTTMVAHPYPSVKAEPSNLVWGLPTLFWGILIGCSVLAILIVAGLVLCCWVLPRSRKFWSPARCSTTSSSARTQVATPRISVQSSAVVAETSIAAENQQTSEHQRDESDREIIMAHSTSKTNGNMAMNGGSGGLPVGGNAHPHHALMYHQSPPQYNPPPVPPKATICTQTTATTFVTAQQVAQQQQYYQMQAAYQKQQQQQQHKQNYCAQMIQQQQQQQQQSYLNYYRINPGGTGNGNGSGVGVGGTGGGSTGALGAVAQKCSKHSGSSSSNDNSPKVQTNGGGGSNGNNHRHGESVKRHGCAGAAGGMAKGSAVIPATVPDAHKSMWAINNLHTSNSGLTDLELAAYRTRSLPSWGKGNKQRPVSTADDLEELYAKVNFSKKRRNRMRNDEAAIIALCRSKSQNLSGLPLDRDGIVVYDERTAL